MKRKLLAYDAMKMRPKDCVVKLIPLKVNEFTVDEVADKLENKSFRAMFNLQILLNLLHVRNRQLPSIVLNWRLSGSTLDMVPKSSVSRYGLVVVETPYGLYSLDVIKTENNKIKPIDMINTTIRTRKEVEA